MKFAISSHKDYFEKTYEVVLNSLLDVGISEEDIVFFIGGYDDKIHNTLVCESPKTYAVSHNFFEFTAIVSILEMELYEPWWFLLHDTCYVGTNFLNTIKEKGIEGYRTIRLHGIHDSMNMGAYSWEFLKENEKEFLDFLKSPENLQRLKRVLIHTEDFLFNRDKNFVFYSNEHRIESDFINFYGTGLDRKIYHYPGIDIYKIQANWVFKPEQDPYHLTL